MNNKLKFDCGNRNEDCNNATICPCLLFINKQLDSYEKVLQSDVFREATKEEQGDKMSLMTKEQYEDWINRLCSEDRNIKPEWSQPMYICPKCGGGMCKNLWTCRGLAVMPPITEYEYRCDNEQCGNVEYLRG